MGARYIRYKMHVKSLLGPGELEKQLYRRDSVIAESVIAGFYCSFLHFSQNYHRFSAPHLYSRDIIKDQSAFTCTTVHCTHKMDIWREDYRLCMKLVNTTSDDVPAQVRGYFNFY